MPNAVQRGIGIKRRVIVYRFLGFCTNDKLWQMIVNLIQNGNVLVSVAVVMTFEGQFHVFIMIGCFGVITRIMDGQKLPHGNFFIFLLMFFEVLNKQRESKQLMYFGC